MNIKTFSSLLNKTFAACRSLIKMLKSIVTSISKKTYLVTFYILYICIVWYTSSKIEIFLRCLDLSLIFSELCNALSFYLINENHTHLGELSVMNLLLLCGTHEDYEVFQKTFDFWFSISEEIYTNPKSEKLCALFRDYIYSLIECLCKHCQLDANYVKILIILINFKNNH